METYRIEGESREVGAIGILVPFVQIVAAESSQEAYNEARGFQYAANRDHVLIKQILLLTDDGSTVVEPRAYL